MFHRLVVVAVIFAVSSNAVRAQDKFKPFTSKEGKFTILMSGTPKEQKQSAKTADTETTVHLVIDAIDAGHALIVCFSDVPPANEAVDADKILDGVAEGINQPIKGKIVSSKKIALGKNPGREVHIEMPGNKGIVKAEIFLVGTRLYQIMAVGPESFVHSMQIDRYYKSFKVNE